MRKLIYLIIIITTIGCSSSSNDTINPITLVTSETNSFIKLENTEAFKSELKTNLLWNNYTQGRSISKSLEKVSFITHDKPLYLINNTKDTLYFIEGNIALKDTLAFDSIDSTMQFSTNKIYHAPTHHLFLQKVANGYLLSSKEDVIIKAIDSEKNNNATLEKLLKTASNNTTATFITKSNLLTNTFFDLEKDDTEWKLFDINSSQQQTAINGVEKLNNTVLTFLNQVIKTKHRSPSITPQDASGVKSFITQGFDSIFNNLPINEIGYITRNDSTSIGIFSSFPDDVLSQLSASPTENFREIPIYSINSKASLLNTLQKLKETQEQHLVAVFEDYLLLAPSKNSLLQQISDIKNNSTLEQQEYYLDAFEALPSESHILDIANLPYLAAVKSNSALLKKHKIILLQSTVESGFKYTTFFTKVYNKRVNTNKVEEAFTITLENEIQNTPQFVTNHVTKNQELIVQDVLNNLYLLDKDGSILWKKQLNGKLQGKVEQIDIYNNGRLQLAFTTEKAFYILDRNGNEVKGFPVTFNDPLTQPTAIFDYDLKHEYRFVMTQKSHLYMVDKYGETVKGFTFKKAKDNIIQTPKHFRISGKDYIVFPTEGGHLKIISRTGEDRINTNKTINFSNEPIYWENNTFTTVDNNGLLITIDLKGNVATGNTAFATDAFINKKGIIWTSLDENILMINDHKVTLDFGLYTKPQVFFIHQKYYVVVTDTQTNKTFVYGSTGSLLPNFPVFGKHNVDMGDITNDKHVELCTYSTNQIIIYTIHQ